MDFSLNDEQTALVALADQILTEKATHESLRAIERGTGPRFDAELWKTLGTSGLIGVALPEAYGGAGMSFLEFSAILEKVGRTVAPVPLLETIVFGGLPLMAYGTEAQKQAWLPGIASGEKIVTAALLEELRDPVDPGTTATAEGGAWVLDGNKIAVRAAELAAQILVPARTGAGITVFLVDPAAEGVHLTVLDTTSGQPEADVRLNGVRVEADAILGNLDQGAAIVAEMVLQGNAALCSYAVGACESALALTSDYIKTRKQFDQPIAMFQAVAHRAADSYIDTEAIRLVARQAAWRIAEGLPAETEVAIAAYWASSGGDRVLHAAQHLHGGVGVDRDYPLHRFFLAVRHLGLTLGGESRQLQSLGRLVVA